jgi:hypothetical protein
MAVEHYPNAVFVNLDMYIPTNRFRTVSKAQLLFPCGIPEIKVELELKEAFIKLNQVRASASGKVYAFVTMNETLEKINNSHNGKEGNIKSITLNDWDDKFLMLIETHKGDDIAYYVKSNEVKYLLENCLHYVED